VFKQELFRCAKDFFEETNIWLEDVPFVANINTLSYSVTPAGKGVPNRLMIVFDPAHAPPTRRWVQSGIEMRVPGVITLTFAPSSPANWVATYAKNITDPINSEGFPEIDASAYWIIDKYRDAFFYGTLARLQNEPSKTYSNPKEAARNQQNYISQRSKARSDAVKSNTYGGQRWAFPQSYATRSRGGWV
jgi:hypothetical protein